MLKSVKIAAKIAPAALLLLAAVAAPAHAEKLGLGRPALPAEIDAWDVTVLPDGKGLRPGSGDVSTGDEVFAEKCAMCHGDFAEGLDSWPVLAGGSGTLKDRRPVKTIGSYWPHLSTVWDYIHRSMPFGDAQTVSVDETYAIVAFLLYSNGIVDEDFVLSQDNFTDVKMPNAGGFYPDDRPQTEYPLFSKEACMENCREPVKITKRAVTLNVTPMDPDGEPAGTLPDITVQTQAEKDEQKASTEAAPQEAPTQVAAAEPTKPAADPALIEAGKTVFKKCQACHKVGEGAKNAVGPELNGIVGRAAGTAEGYKYSKALMELNAKGDIWTEENISKFIEKPKAFLPGTKMSFVGLKDEEDRAAVIAYLKSIGQ